MTIDEMASRVAQMYRRLELGIENAFPPVLLAQFAASLARSAEDLSRVLGDLPSTFVGPIHADPTLPTSSVGLLMAMLGDNAPDTVPEHWTA